ncbi:AzlD domain-containing protein [Vitreoscilla massiliensis]|uniref:AzlD domain-containing protein n=1 Tax=Vitreoscilla massiliensis TaxID=1689272 RepID=A0ABY4E5V7_9NEIS|nr:AzlD domain-containing protein [Vitreoscilla massiliensis]UOO91164.1 AzlD domain-containing protein [Vitreoscilla massiliensis]
MTWPLLLTLAAVVFFNRYVFLEPKVAVRLPKLLERMLHYAAPCLLTAICVPIVFYDEAGAWRGLSHNAYLYAALFCIAIAWKTRRVLLSMGCSMVVFYGLMYWVL